ncbi:YybH family protein [Cryptosporangium arvum]|uniref:YybH family protein n=1 Tax=Cryptosporangium arvum TaxID=80871 RepID=UPI0004ACF606|nr:DUF4440 domain-containing protein [Cryptosporangium arvum]
MDDNDPARSDVLALTTVAAEHPHVFARAFATGDGAIVDAVYEPRGVLVTAPGRCTRTSDGRIEGNRRVLDLGLPITVEPRHVYVADDIALLIVDWTIDGTDAGGEHVHLEGTATDVARRGADGCWRYVIDNPFGTVR